LPGLGLCRCPASVWPLSGLGLGVVHAFPVEYIATATDEEIRMIEAEAPGGDGKLRRDTTPAAHPRLATATLQRGNLPLAAQ